MKKLFAIVAAVALLVTPAVVYACSVHGSIAGTDINNYLNGGSSNYGNGSSDESSSALDQFSVWGSQGGSGNNRTYWVEVTSPFGETVHFETTWGETPNGWTIEDFLADSGIQWIENWFDAHFGPDGQVVTDPNAVGNSSQSVESFNG